jgi:hypothetical protein
MKKSLMEGVPRLMPFMEGVPRMKTEDQGAKELVPEL